MTYKMDKEIGDGAIYSVAQGWNGGVIHVMRITSEMDAAFIKNLS